MTLRRKAKMIARRRRRIKVEGRTRKSTKRTIRVRRIERTESEKENKKDR